MSAAEKGKEGTEVFKREIKDAYAILNYFTSSASSHSSYILVCFFGLFSILTIVTAFSKISDPFSFGWAYLLLVSAYASIVSLGMYEIRRWKFYSDRAKHLANFFTIQLSGADDFGKAFCEILEKDKSKFYEKIFVDEWKAVRETGLSLIFDYAEWLFPCFCTMILAGVFVGVYGEDIAKALFSGEFSHPFPLLSSFVIIIYTIPLVLMLFQLRKISGSIK
ncbi:hypothetical protein GTO27_09895 [Candidatus Bathyarchaeota archaeon]|nr:hypothetical protein [Candidatus Bathyarchaeota archaeon]